MDNGKKIDLRPIGAALGHMSIYDDGSVLVNPAMISHWIVDQYGTLFLYMQSGRAFSMTPEQAEKFIAKVNQAIEITRAQIEQRIIPASPRGM